MGDNNGNFADGSEDKGEILPSKYELNSDEKETLSRVLGDITGELCSGRWQSRRDTLQQILDRVSEFRNSKLEVKEQVVIANNIILSKLVTDSVLQVFSLCIELSRKVYGEMGEGVRLAQIEQTLTNSIPLVLQRTGDVNQKICNTASEFILYLSSLPNIGSTFVGRFVLTPLANLNALKAVVSRLSLLQQFIVQHGFATDGEMSLPRVMDYVCFILNNCSNKKVQQQASLLVVEAFRRKGKQVEECLKSLKPSVMKFLKSEIESEINDVDAFQDAEVKEKEEEDVSNLEEFTEEEQRKMQPLVDIFGKGIGCLFSKKWKLRQSALERLLRQFELKKVVERSNNVSIRQKFVHSCNVVSIGLDDPVPSVYCIACGMVLVVVSAFGTVVPEGDLKLCLERIILQLMTKINDLNLQVKQAAVDALVGVSRFPKIGPAFVVNYIISPLGNISQWRPIVGKLELLCTMCQEFNFAPDQLAIEPIMSWTVSTFECPSEKVRKAAVNVVVEVYKKTGNVVRMFISNQKPALVQELKSKIIKIARKDRTKSAPIQRLANIVQPLQEGTISPEVPQGAPLLVGERPSTYNVPIEDQMSEQDHISVREKWSNWKRQQMKEQGIEVEPTLKEVMEQVKQEKAEKVKERKPAKRGNLVFT